MQPILRSTADFPEGFPRHVDPTRPILEVREPEIGMARKEPRMLVLSRQRDETIMIGDDVEITVVDIRGDKVRLGITAPRHIQVHRKEVYEAIKRENQQAAELRPQDVPASAPTGSPTVASAREPAGAPPTEDAASNHRAPKTT
jgi:carbon storage regulator